MLFKTSADLVRYATIDPNINFAAVEKTIRNAELWHLVPILGRTLYDSLNSAYRLITDENNLSPADKNLLDMCRMMIGPYVCYYYAPKADVQLSESGMQRTENGTNKSAFQEQRADFKDAQLREAEANGEFLYEFLEENRSSYPEWTNSPAFAEFRSLFIKTGREMGFYFSTASPYRNYYVIRPKMREVEATIRKQMGAGLFDALKAKDASATGSFTAKEKELLQQLKYAITYLSVSFSLQYLNARIDENGLTMMNSQRSTRDSDTKRTAATVEAVRVMMDATAASGNRWLTEALAFVKDNAADFPAWQAPEAAPPMPKINEGLTGVFGL